MNTTKELDIQNNMYKGIFLGIAITIFFILLMISLWRSVLSDPGYLPKPTDLEYEITSLSILHNPEHRTQKSLEIQEIQEDFERAPLSYSEIHYLKQRIVNSRIIHEDEVESMNLIPGAHGYPVININETKVRYNACSQKTIQFENKEDIYENFRPFIIDSSSLCVTCLRMKCERVHHCRMCGRCVRKMDHHCPWIANCVGFRNYKFFNLMNFYGLITTLIFLLSFWELLVELFTSKKSTFMQCVFYLFVYISAIGFLAFLSWLNYNNLILVFTGQTIIEQSDRERFPSSKSHNDYDLGCYKNFTAVFGHNPLLWLLPVCPNLEGDGVIFDKNTPPQSVLQSDPI